jgi:hypothetical protein
MLPRAAVPPLLLFMALLLALALHGLAAAGHFPQEHRSPALRSRLGSLVLFGSIVIALISLGAGLLVAWQRIPWYAATIGGGGMVLVAPVLLQLFSDRFVDGPGALIAFAGTGMLFAFVLIWMV